MLIKLMEKAGAPNQDGRKCWFENNRGVCGNAHDQDVWKDVIPAAGAPTTWPDAALSNA